MHCEVEVRVIPFYGFYEIANGYCGIQFLLYLTCQRLLWCFTLFHLAAGKLPPVFEIPIATLCGKYLVTTPDNSSYNFYPLHYIA